MRRPSVQDPDELSFSVQTWNGTEGLFKRNSFSAFATPFAYAKFILFDFPPIKRSNCKHSKLPIGRNYMETLFHMNTIKMNFTDRIGQMNYFFILASITYVYWPKMKFRTEFFSPN